MQVPTPENYAQWYQDRIDRTIAVMKNNKTIPGYKIRKENLSMALLYRSGYVLNADDVMEKKNG